MKKLLFIYFTVLQTLLYGCAACQLMTPTAHISLDLDVNNKKLTSVHIEWKFSDVFTKAITEQYDKNSNKHLDAKELDSVKKAMLDYLIPKNMLTKVQYADYEDNESTTLKPEYKNFKIYMRDNLLIFSYDAIFDFFIKDKTMLSFSFSDNESFFNFTTKSLNINSDELFYDNNLYLGTASIYFKYSQTQTKEIFEVQKQQVEKKTIQSTLKDKPKDSNIQENLLKSSISKIKSLFESIKDEKNPLTYIFLLFFSYIYGVVHALGPGHGKTLVGSYFLSNERSYSKALFISLAIGLVHTFSAFFLTLIIYYIVDTFLAQFLDQSVYYTTKISATIIIVIALYLIYKKYKAYKMIKNTPKYSFSSIPHVATCSCSACKVDNNSTDAALIVSAGIIPCPGTVTIFIFSLSLGLYYAGFLSALVMSLGMSTVIFVSALISVVIRKKTSMHNEKFKKYLEYTSLIIILLLGLFLLML